MLILEREHTFDYCPACGGIIENNDYFYSRLPTYRGFRCRNCGSSQFFVWDDNR